MRRRTPSQLSAQNDAYRRGLVLGLTLAEVGILVIFVLLLLLVITEATRTQLLQRYKDAEPVPAEALRRYERESAVLKEVANALELSAVEGDSTTDFVKLVRVVREAAATPSARTALAEAKTSLADIKRAREELRRILAAGGKGNADDIAREVEAKSFQLANQAGQLSGLEKKLVAVGQGKGERPCWVEPDGTIVYLYDVVLASNGIRMRERTYASRERERALLPASAADPTEVLSQGTFSARTYPLFEYSKKINCRFFVVVYDATEAHEKVLYKRLLSTVEDHFYKLLSRDAAPF